jgi:hypothetical protein
VVYFLVGAAGALVAGAFVAGALVAGALVAGAVVVCFTAGTAFFIGGAAPSGAFAGTGPTRSKVILTNVTGVFGRLSD